MADDVLSARVICLTAFLCKPIPCTSGGVFDGSVESPKSVSLWLVLSKKSSVDVHSSLSNCITGTSVIEFTPSKLLATVSAYQLPYEITFLAPVPASAPAAGLTHIACCPIVLQLEPENCMSLGAPVKGGNHPQ